MPCGELQTGCGLIAASRRPLRRREHSKRTAKVGSEQALGRNLPQQVHCTRRIGNGGLRLISPVAEPPKALRLGSVRLEESFRAKRVDLRNLFGTE